MDTVKLFKLLSELEDFERRKKGAAKHEIAKIEEVLNVRLPQDYVTFLNEFGHITSSYLDVYGVSEDNAWDVIHQTKLAREREFPVGFANMSLDGVVIRKYGGGGVYFLFAQDSPRSGEVSLLLDETFNREAQKWNSFNAYLSYSLI